MDEEKCYSCRQKNCTKSYSTKYSLQRHYSIRHSKSKRFNCKFCKKILSSNQNLKEHLFTHSNEKPLKCSFPGCHKEFRQSSQLSTHKKFHMFALKNSTMYFSIKSLKVIIKQLTDLLKHGQESARVGCFCQRDSHEFVNIPKIFALETLDKVQLSVNDFNVVS